MYQGHVNSGVMEQLVQRTANSLPTCLMIASEMSGGVVSEPCWLGSSVGRQEEEKMASNPGRQFVQAIALSILNLSRRPISGPP